MSVNKQVHIIAGGTISKIRPHFALCAPAYDSVGRTLEELAKEQFPEMDSIALNTVKFRGTAGFAVGPRGRVARWNPKAP